MNFLKIEAFQAEFISKLKGTYAAAKADPNYSPFLRHFNKERVSAMAEVDVTGIEAIMRRLDGIDASMREIKGATIGLRARTPYDQFKTEAEATFGLSRRHVDTLLGTVKELIYDPGMTCGGPGWYESEVRNSLVSELSRRMKVPSNIVRVMLEDWLKFLHLLDGKWSMEKQE